MDIMKKFLILLAIFCIIGSAAAVSAADVYDDQGGYLAANDEGVDEVYGSQSQDDLGGYAGSNYQDDGGWAGSQYQDDGGWAGSQYNESNEGSTDRPLIDPDYAHMEPGSNSTGNATNDTAPVTGNATVNPTNASAAVSHTMLSTGNPILALFAVCAVLGGYTVLRRK